MDNISDIQACCSDCKHSEVCKYKDTSERLQSEMNNIDLNNQYLHVVIKCDKYETMYGIATVRSYPYVSCDDHINISSNA